MAEDTNIAELSKNDCNYLDMSFKEKFFEAYNWTEDQWDSGNRGNNRFKRLIVSAKHWRTKLSEAFDDLNVIISLYSEAPSAFLSPLEIVDIAEESYKGVKVHSYNRFKNPRYLALNFDTKELKNLFVTTVKKIGVFDVFFLDWSPGIQETVIRVHWVPRKIEQKRIDNLISKYLNIKSHKLEFATSKAGKTMGCGVHVFAGVVKKEVSLSAIPHITYIGSLEILLTIGSRPPLCLRCNNLGHKAHQCKSVYCKTCKMRTLKQHVCKEVGERVKSYADTLKTNDDEEDEDEEDMYFDREERITVDQFYAQSRAIGGPKVSKIDNKLKALNIQTTGSHQITSGDTTPPPQELEVGLVEGVSHGTAPPPPPPSRLELENFYSSQDMEHSGLQELSDTPFLQVKPRRRRTRGSGGVAENTDKDKEKESLFHAGVLNYSKTKTRATTKGEMLFKAIVQKDSDEAKEKKDQLNSSF